MAEVLGEDNVVQFQEQQPVCFLNNSTNVGGITAEELAVVIRSLDQNPSEEEVEELMNDEIAELITLMAQSFKETENEDEFKEAFKVFDKDQTGYISATELRNVMVNLGEKLTEEEAQLMIKEADSDGDGLVNYDDFVKMMRTL